MVIIIMVNRSHTLNYNYSSVQWSHQWFWYL